MIASPAKITRCGATVMRPRSVAIIAPHSAVGGWARELLGRLEGDTRNVRRTLRTWIAAGGNAERAAQSLGVHAQTVREHVRSAEPVLERVDPARQTPQRMLQGDLLARPGNGRPGDSYHTPFRPVKGSPPPPAALTPGTAPT